MLITSEDQYEINHTNVLEMSNRDMAAVLFNIATVLRQDGNVNPYRTAAYERGARALMGLRREASEVLSKEDQVAFRRRQHIGVRLQAKIREMAKTGELNQYRDLLDHLPDHQRELMSVPGIGPKLADVLFHEANVSNVAELVQSARNGRLRRVRGFGRTRCAQIAALPLPQDAAASGQLSLFS